MGWGERFAPHGSLSGGLPPAVPQPASTDAPPIPPSMARDIPRGDTVPDRGWVLRLYRCPTCTRPAREVHIELRGKTRVVCDAGHTWSPENQLQEVAPDAQQ